MSDPSAPIRERHHDQPPPPSSGGPAPSREHAEGAGAIGWGLLLIAAGGLWGLSLSGVAIRWDLVWPAALVIAGGLVVLGARGGARSGLVGVGATLAVVALVAMVFPVPVATGAGDRTYVVSEAATLAPSYELAAGQLVLDLRDLELVDGTTTEVAGRVTAGELVVRVPEDAVVVGDARAAMGEIVALGRTSAGIRPSLGPALGSDEAAPPNAPTLALDLEVGLGRVEVTH